MPVNKVKRRGSYAPLSSHYYKDDRLIRAGEKAELLYVRGLAFCADVLNDGFITDAQLAHVGVGLSGLKARAKSLVDVGAWERCSGGFMVVAWLSWNKSRQDILEDNRKDADRKGPQGSDQPLPPEPPLDEMPDSDPWDRTHSERNPNGIQTGSHAYGSARAPSNSTPEPELPLPSGGGAGAPAGADAVASTEIDKPKRGRPRQPTNDAKFDEFWSVWPRKIAKADAQKKFAAIAKKTDPDRIVAAAKAQAEEWAREGKEMRYIPHPATWLNQGRYDDHVEQSGLRLVAGGTASGGYRGSESPWAREVGWR